MAYPNPDRVVYPTGQPLAFPCQLTTRDAARLYPMHNHGAWLSPEGDGNTDVDAGHYHRVKNFRVLPDESDGHTHTLTQLPCGAGAPRTLPSGQPSNALAAVGGTSMMMGGAPGPAPIWPWIVGGIVVVGVIVAGVMIYKHAHDEG